MCYLPGKITVFAGLMVLLTIMTTPLPINGHPNPLFTGQPAFEKLPDGILPPEKPVGFTLRDSCEYLEYACNLAYYWPMPNVNDMDNFAMRFTPALNAPCTVKTVYIGLYGDAMTGNPDLQIFVGSDDFLDSGNAFCDTIPNSYLPPYGSYYMAVPITDTDLVVNAGQEFYVAAAAIGGEGDTLAFLSDDGSCGGLRGLLRYQDEWSTMYDLYGIDQNFVFAADICYGDPIPLIRIEKEENHAAGDTARISIILESGIYEMGGFDFLIAYEYDPLVFLSAAMGQFLTDCEWEYFTYQITGAPSDGLVNITAIADINNGNIHPSCFGPPDTDPHELATLEFLIQTEIVEGRCYPVRFYWADCGDNVVSDITSDTTFHDRRVYSHYDSLLWDEENDADYPEPERLPNIGAPDYCLGSTGLRRYDFHDGGVAVEITEPVYSISDVYEKIDSLNGQEIKIFAQYAFDGDSKLINLYAEYQLYQLMPKNSVVYLEGTLPDQAYWYGGTMIVKGTIHTEPNPIPRYGDDSIIVVIDADTYEYIIEGRNIVPPESKGIYEKGVDKTPDNSRACDECRFAILVGPASFDPKDPNEKDDFWNDIADMYAHKTNTDPCGGNYCDDDPDQNVIVLFGDGTSPDPGVPVDNASSAANIQDAHDDLAAKIEACKQQGKEVTVQKMFSCHGCPDGSLALGGGEYLAPDELLAMEQQLIDAGCDYLYDEFLQCYGGIMVEKMKELEEDEDAEEGEGAQIHANSAAADDAVAIGDDGDGSAYLDGKIEALENCDPYEEAVYKAEKKYLDYLDDGITYLEEEIERQKVTLNDWAVFSIIPVFLYQQILEKVEKLEDIIYARSRNCPSWVRYPSESKYAGLLKVQPMGQLGIECDNLHIVGEQVHGTVTLYEILPNGSRVRVKIWDWNLAGGVGYEYGNEYRVHNVRDTSTGSFYLHFDDEPSWITVESFCDRPEPAESPSNPEDYALFSLGSLDNSSAEFGYQSNSYHTSYGTDADGFNLSDVPRVIGGTEFVSQYDAHFAPQADNGWWDDMELYIQVLSVYTPGRLQVVCSTAANIVNPVDIDTAGYYTVHLGAVTAPSESILSFTADGTLSFTWDCWGVHSIVPAESPVVCGDASNDEIVNILDITYMINYLYRGGPPPIPPSAGDVNSDLALNILDITYLINYLYKGGPAPDCP